MLYDLEKNLESEEINGLISICKSCSGVMGKTLREAHYQLGKILAQSYRNALSDACIISFLRAALPFSLGIADIFDCPILFYDSTDTDFFNKNRTILEKGNILFVDAVINSGEEMLSAVRQSDCSASKIKIVTNVLCAKSIEKFIDYDLFTVRVSENSFKGEKIEHQQGNLGPDTGDRLFRTM